VQAASRVRRESAEQFCGGKNDDVGGGKTKAARQRALDKIDTFQWCSGGRVGRSPGRFCGRHGPSRTGSCPYTDDFAEALDLPFGLKIDDDARLVLAPIA
jgi:hypothetical protein